PPPNGQIEGLSRWEFWWETNRDVFLRQALAANASRFAAGTVVPMFSGNGDASDLVTPEEARKRIVPLLIRRLGSRDAEERAIAAVSLGNARAGAALGPLRALLAKGTVTDRRAAALALGFLGDPAAEPALVELLGRRGVSPAERAYAALALGFLGGDRAKTTLRKALAESLAFEGRAIEELQAATAVSLGLLEDRKAVPLLATIARSKARRAQKVRAAAAVALGRVGDASALPVLVALLEKSPIEVRRAAAQALGLLKAPGAKLALTVAIEEDSDVSVRCFAAMALAEIGGRGVAPTLRSGLAAKEPRALRGFCALALGVLGDEAQVARLRQVLELNSETSLRGAAAIGLAMLRDLGAKPKLRRIAAERGEDEDLRGYAGTALAMLGDPVNRYAIRRRARKNGAADLRRAATLSLGLYPELPAGPVLLHTLLEDGDPHVRGAVMASLAAAPRKPVLDELLAMADSRSLDEDSRKDVLSALGVMARAGRPAPAEALLRGVNYRSMTRTVRDVVFLF
ncbi:MAG: HEAT repeat domain-containing protein, partial [Planctomycetota bacterium]